MTPHLRHKPDTKNRTKRPQSEKLRQQLNCGLRFHGHRFHEANVALLSESSLVPPQLKYRMVTAVTTGPFSAAARTYAALNSCILSAPLVMVMAW